MKPLIISTLLFLTSFSNKNTETKTGEFICILTTDKTVYKVGQVPKLEVQIINESYKEIYLIGSLDGSDDKSRMPYCYFTIVKPKPDTIIFPGCKITNPIRTEDFVLVKPKGKFNPFQSIDDYGFFGDHTTTQKETFQNAGIYKIQFHYSTDTNKIENFMGSFGQWSKGADSMKIKSLLARVPKMDIISNRVDISFEE